MLPQLLNHTTPRNKSARSSGSFLLEDGQLALPKTFVTRKGAIILFTPSEDLCHHENGENHLNKENIYEAGLKLRTLGNLTNSVLEFGKEVRLLCICSIHSMFNIKIVFKYHGNYPIFWVPWAFFEPCNGTKTHFPLLGQPMQSFPQFLKLANFVNQFSFDQRFPPAQIGEGRILSTWYDVFNAISPVLTTSED